jgi:hypothetical protein
VIDLAEYCREIETYLCRKNEGHLIRIVGPAFEQVCSWAERGVPLKIAFSGIDRCCERHQAKSSRRRPVRIEFCEADILDAFDDWRRAVGMDATASAGESSSPESPGRRGTLARHIEIGLARLRALPASNGRSSEFMDALDRAVGELDGLSTAAQQARGEKRARIVERLAALDDELIAASIVELDPGRAEELKREAEVELAPFGGRLSADAWEGAVGAAFQRLVREAFGLPRLAYE